MDLMISMQERKIQGISIPDVRMRATKPQMLLTLILEQEHLITSGWQQQEWESTLGPQKDRRLRSSSKGTRLTSIHTHTITPALMILELVKITAYLRGLQMATKRSKAMARSTEDSMSVNPCRKNICTIHPSRPMILALNQRTPSVVGREERVMPTSVAESMERKQYIGSWRLESVTTTQRIVLFPKRAITQKKQKGMENQMWKASNPGTPVKKKVAGVELAVDSMVI